jgi:hypothetical protein
LADAREPRRHRICPVRERAGTRPPKLGPEGRGKAAREPSTLQSGTLIASRCRRLGASRRAEAGTNAVPQKPASSYDSQSGRNVQAFKIILKDDFRPPRIASNSRCENGISRRLRTMGSRYSGLLRRVFLRPQKGQTRTRNGTDEREAAATELGTCDCPLLPMWRTAPGGWR